VRTGDAGVVAEDRSGSAVGRRKDSFPAGTFCAPAALIWMNS